MRVLMAEDDQTFSAEVAVALRAQGCHVQFARTASEAVALLEEEPFSLVLLDLVLESGDGLAILDRMRKDKRDVPVIVITEHLRSYVSELASFFEQVKLIVAKPYPARALAMNVAALAAEIA